MMTPWGQCTPSYLCPIEQWGGMGWGIRDENEEIIRLSRKYRCCRWWYQENGL